MRNIYIRFYIVESKEEYIGGMIKSIKMDPGNEYDNFQRSWKYSRCYVIV